MKLCTGKGKIARLLAALLIAALLAAGLPVWQPQALAASDGMVRVRISKLSAGKSASFSATCAYALEGGGVRIDAGDSFTVSVSGGELYLTAGGSKRAMGKTFALLRQRGGAYGVKGTSPSTTNLLCGDLLFSVASSNLQTVLRIYVEDYLCGVIGYEMSNSSHLEALKAQAVAARNYVLRRKAARGSLAYDVVDGANDQVYRGFVASYTRVIQAVQETKGLVLYAGGSLASCFYGDSNGGQTESTKNAWGSNLAYSVVKDDPYDLESTTARVRTAVINKDGSGLNSSLRSALVSGMGAALKERGLSARTADIAITRITGITAHSPRYAEPSRLYQKLRFKLQVTSKNDAGKTVPAEVSVDVNTYGAFESWYGLSINSGSNETVAVEETGSAFKVVFRRWGHGVGMSQCGAQVMAKNHGMSCEQILAFYFPGTTATRLILADTSVGGQDGSTPTVAPTPALNAVPDGTYAQLTLSSASGSMNLRSGPGTENASLGTLGHGTYLQVLGTTGEWAQVRTQGGDTGFVKIKYLALVQAASTPTPSPEPTPTPSVAAPAETEEPLVIAARVKLSAPTSKMNLRKGPSTSTSVVAILSHGDLVQVIGAEKEWCQVRTADGKTGYVKAQYLQLAEAGSAAAPTPTPAPTAVPETTASPAPTEQAVYAKVQLASGSGAMNVRSQPNTSCKVVTTLKHGAYVRVLAVSGQWCRVETQNGKRGYVKKQYLKKVALDPTQSAPTPAPTANNGIVYADLEAKTTRKAVLRKSASTSGKALATLAKGTVVHVRAYNATWVYVDYGGKRGYILRKHLKVVK